MAHNVHGCALAVAVGGTVRGVLVLGASGSGKTTLVAETLARARALGRFARWVADDRVELERAGEAVVARPPPSLAGRVEVPFGAVSAVDFLPRCLLDAVVRLDGERPLRIPDVERTTTGVPGTGPLPLLRLPPQCAQAGAAALLAWLDAGCGQHDA